MALNCVANGRLLREGVFDDLWIQPAAGDAGGALGAALARLAQRARQPAAQPGRGADAMRGAYLGPGVHRGGDPRLARRQGPCPTASSPTPTGPARWPRLIAAENVVGLLQGRMEFGPRALGNRSIVGDARSPKMQSVMNLKIKYRESFRPFAPSVLAERVAEWFELDRPSPYMLLVADVAPGAAAAAARRRGRAAAAGVGQPAALDIPAVTHVDYSARVQTVHAETNPRYHALLREFEELTGCPVIVNTSFNVRGEPIVLHARRTPTAASCAPRWTTSSSVPSCSTSGSSRRRSARRTPPGRTRCLSTERPRPR